MKDDKKSFHNPKTVVFKEQNRKNKIKIDLRTVRKKVLPKLDESQRQKEVYFVLTFWQEKKLPVSFFVFSFVGFICFVS